MKENNYRKKASLNGQYFENAMYNYLSILYGRVKYINKEIDLFVNGKYIEIKSCQEWQTDNSANGKRRHGRFVLDKKQHVELLKNEGYYLFVVHNEKKIIFVKMLPAAAIDFKRLITWTTIKKIADKLESEAYDVEF